METRNIQKGLRCFQWTHEPADEWRGSRTYVPMHTLFPVCLPWLRGAGGASPATARGVGRVTCFVVTCSNLESAYNTFLFNHTSSFEHFCIKWSECSHISPSHFLCLVLHVWRVQCTDGSPMVPYQAPRAGTHVRRIKRPLPLYKHRPCVPSPSN